MLHDLGGIERQQGRQWLQRSGGSVKLALLMADRGLSLEQAQGLLNRCQGQLRRALLEAPQPPNAPQ
jgi:N-acetylmuramic acid 6-phosphate etherase